MKFCILAGVTGGHIMPALELSRVLRAHGHDIHWLGASGGQEVVLAERAGFQVHVIKLKRLRSTGRWHWLFVPWRLLFACIKAWRILRHLSVDRVIGFGGMLTAPGGVAAYLLNKPLILHEQNAVIGLTNRCLSYFASGIITAFPKSAYHNSRIRSPLHYLGCPIRQALIEVGKRRKEQAYSGHMSTSCKKQPEKAGTDQFRLLILGGSLGALALNRFLPEVIQALLKANVPLLVHHQCGQRHILTLQTHYKQLSLPDDVINITPFIESIEKAYAWADLVIARAGGMTISELSATASASILIPYPHAADQHQHANADYYVAQHASIIQTEATLQIEPFANLLMNLINNTKKLIEMRRAAHALAKPRASEQMLKILQQF